MKFVERIRNAFFKKLGTCGLCMRLNLRGALAGWAATLAAAYFGFEYWYLILPWPAAFTVLWALHVATFAGGVMHAVQRNAPAGGNARLMTRRFVIARGFKAAAAAILISAAIPELAAAQGCPGGMHPCGGSDKCCPNGMNYYCASNECDGHTNWCYAAATDENYKWLLGCCAGLLAC